MPHLKRLQGLPATAFQRGQSAAQLVPSPRKPQALKRRRVKPKRPPVVTQPVAGVKEIF